MKIGIIIETKEYEKAWNAFRFAVNAKKLGLGFSPTPPLQFFLRSSPFQFLESNCTASHQAPAQIYQLLVLRS